MKICLQEVDLYILQLSSDSEASLPQNKSRGRKPEKRSAKGGAKGGAAPKRKTNAIKRMPAMNDKGSSEEEQPQTRQAGQGGRKAGRRPALEHSSDVECLLSDSDEGSHGQLQKHARTIAADKSLAGRKMTAKHNSGVKAKELRMATDAAVAVSDSGSGERPRAGRGAAGQSGSRNGPLDGDPFELPCSNSDSEDASPEWVPAKKPRKTARTRAAAPVNKGPTQQPRRAQKPQPAPPQPQRQKRAKPDLPPDASGDIKADSPLSRPHEQPETPGVPPVDLTREAFPAGGDPQNRQPGKEVLKPQLRTMIRKRPKSPSRPGSLTDAHLSKEDVGVAAEEGREAPNSPAPGVSSMLASFLSPLGLRIVDFASNGRLAAKRSR